MLSNIRPFLSPLPFTLAASMTIEKLVSLAMRALGLVSRFLIEIGIVVLF